MCRRERNNVKVFKHMDITRYRKRKLINAKFPEDLTIEEWRDFIATTELLGFGGRDVIMVMPTNIAAELFHERMSGK